MFGRDAGWASANISSVAGPLSNIGDMDGLERPPDLVGEAVEYPPHILDLLLPRLRGGGGKIALVDAEAELSYRDLDKASASIATVLLERGIRPSDVVLIHARLSRRAIVAMLGVLRAGASYVAVDAAFPQARQWRIAQASGARVALVEPRLPFHLGLESVLIEYEGAAGGVGPLPVPAADGPAYTCFTSGSTGEPKGVTVSARGLAYSTAARTQFYGQQVSGFLLCSAISFDSSVAGIYWTLANGGRLIIPSDRPMNLLALAQAAQQHQASHLLVLPSLYSLALGAGLGGRLRSLTTTILAGEVCSPALVRLHHQELPETALYNEYGPTECTVWSTVHRCLVSDADRSSVPIGRPIPGTVLHVGSPATGAAVAPGEPGELWISGPGVAPNVGEPVANGRRYRTGDLVSVGSDGTLSFCGRVDGQLKLGGMRIESSEIENALLADHSIAAAGIGVVHREAGLAQVVAFVVARAAGVDIREVRRGLLERLPGVAVPHLVIVVKGLPLLPNGKLDRRELNRLASTSVAAAGDHR